MNLDGIIPLEFQSSFICNVTHPAPFFIENQSRVACNITVTVNNGMKQWHCTWILTGFRYEWIQSRLLRNITVNDNNRYETVTLRVNLDWISRKGIQRLLTSTIILHDNLDWFSRKKGMQWNYSDIPFSEQALNLIHLSDPWPIMQ